MATPRAIENYPAQYCALFNTAIAREVSIPFSCPSAARAARSRLYAFRRALERDGLRYPRVAIMAPLLEFKITDSILTVSIPRSTML